MSNMSYCRFENTLRDLSDCQNALEGLFAGEQGKLSDEELRHAKALVQCCIDIASRVADQRGICVNEEDGMSDLESSIDEILDEANDAAEA